MAKGCGMLAPNMATMLAFLTTDAELSPEELKPILFRAADATFNALITDGATSTNDTVMLFASGRKGRPADLARFEDDVRQVCEELMLQMARDAEGMTKLVVDPRHRRGQRCRGAEGRPLDRQQPADQVQLVRRRRLLGPPAGRSRDRAGSSSKPRSPASAMAGSGSPRPASKSPTMPRRCATT